MVRAPRTGTQRAQGVACELLVSSLWVTCEIHNVNSLWASCELLVNFLLVAHQLFIWTHSVLQFLNYSLGLWIISNYFQLLWVTSNYFELLRTTSNYFEQLRAFASSVRRLFVLPSSSLCADRLIINEALMVPLHKRVTRTARLITGSPSWQHQFRTKSVVPAWYQVFSWRSSIGSLLFFQFKFFHSMSSKVFSSNFEVFHLKPSIRSIQFEVLYSKFSVVNRPDQANEFERSIHAAQSTMHLRCESSRASTMLIARLTSAENCVVLELKNDFTLLANLFAKLESASDN